MCVSDIKNILLKKKNNCLTREDNSDFLWWYPLTNSSQTCEVAQSPAEEAWLQV